MLSPNGRDQAVTPTCQHTEHTQIIGPGISRNSASAQAPLTDATEKVNAEGASSLPPDYGNGLNRLTFAIPDCRGTGWSIVSLPLEILAPMLRQTAPESRIDNLQVQDKMSLFSLSWGDNEPKVNVQRSSGPPGLQTQRQDLSDMRLVRSRSGGGYGDFAHLPLFPFQRTTLPGR